MLNFNCIRIAQTHGCMIPGDSVSAPKRTTHVSTVYGPHPSFSQYDELAMLPRCRALCTLTEAFVMHIIILESLGTSGFFKISLCMRVANNDDLL